MSLNSKIEWTHSSWNPVTGCSKISPGCMNCYAERMSLRLKAMGNGIYSNGFKVTVHENLLEKPLNWQKPQIIFVNSMSDLFHKNVPDEFIFKVFEIMREANWHIFQILTKRSLRLKELSKEIEWPKNVWMGVSVETENYISRIEHLCSTTAVTKFISFEPLLGEIKNFDFQCIDWVIVGGESGPKARQIKNEWVLDIFKQCQASKVPFFFKQWGGFNKKKSGRLFLDKTWDEMPLKKCL